MDQLIDKLALEGVISFAAHDRLCELISIVLPHASILEASRYLESLSRNLLLLLTYFLLLRMLFLLFLEHLLYDVVAAINSWDDFTQRRDRTSLKLMSQLDQVTLTHGLPPLFHRLLKLLVIHFGLALFPIRFLLKDEELFLNFIRVLGPTLNQNLLSPKDFLLLRRHA